MHKDYSNDFTLAYDEQRHSCTISFRCFDTPNSVTAYQVDAPDYAIESVLLAARRECLRLHGLWSFSLPDSDIARLNEPGSRVEVAPETAALIGAMRTFHECEPSFDFTVGAVSFLWKKARRLPTEEELESALAHVGAENIRVEGHAVRKLDPHARIDVGAAAKGYAADMVADLLGKSGIECADVDLGGNLFMMGEHPSGRPWRVSVRVPQGVTCDPIVLEVRNRSVVTSGSYERFVEIGGKRYTHIIDAQTGWPVESDIESATVVAESSLQADMLATTALALGSGEIGALASRHPGCDIIAITNAGEVLRPGK